MTILAKKGALWTGSRSIAVSANAGSFGSPELGVRAGGQAEYAFVLWVLLGTRVSLP
jgi:hypothetical protein